MPMHAQAAGAHLSEIYPLLPWEPVKGEGVYLHDGSGRRVLDLYAGHAVAALGYGHPRLIEAIVRQTRALMFQSNAVPLKVRDEAAQKLADFAPTVLERVMFVNSGAEANENALRLALKLTGRAKIVALEHGFHGRTAAAAAATWGAVESWYGFPDTPMDVSFVARDDPQALASQIDRDTAAVIIEPVQGVSGAYDLSREFIEVARHACDRTDALLILDEVQTGMGRLGRPFGADLFSVDPDILTTAKGLAGGLPAGAVLMRADVARDLGPGSLGTTFGGGPVICAAINAVIRSSAGERRRCSKFRPSSSPIGSRRRFTIWTMRSNRRRSRSNRLNVCLPSRRSSENWGIAIRHGAAASCASTRFIAV